MVVYHINEIAKSMFVVLKGKLAIITQSEIDKK